MIFLIFIFPVLSIVLLIIGLFRLIRGDLQFKESFKIGILSGFAPLAALLFYGIVTNWSWLYMGVVKNAENFTNLLLYILLIFFGLGIFSGLISFGSATLTQRKPFFGGLIAGFSSFSIIYLVSLVSFFSWIFKASFNSSNPWNIAPWNTSGIEPFLATPAVFYLRIVSDIVFILPAIIVGSILGVILRRYRIDR